MMTKDTEDNNLQVFDGGKHGGRDFLRVIQRVKVAAMLDSQAKLMVFLHLQYYDSVILKQRKGYREILKQFLIQTLTDGLNSTVDCNFFFCSQMLIRFLAAVCIS